MESAANFPRLFTVEEANGLLSAIRPLIENILENLRRLKSKSESVIRSEQLDPEAPDLMKRLRRDEEIARLVGQIKGWVEEIQGHGCVCKEIEQARRFPCVLGAEVVFAGSTASPTSTIGTASKTASPAAGRCSRSTTRIPKATRRFIKRRRRPSDGPMIAPLFLSRVAHPAPKRTP
jgi:hypothetical protein